MFGMKRADKLCRNLSDMHFRHDNLELAERYARLGIAMNTCRAHDCKKLNATKKRQADRHEQLARVLECRGKHDEADRELNLAEELRHTLCKH
jgi:hypothetical protein